MPICVICQIFRQALNSSFALNGMKLKDADLEAIVLRVTKYKLPTRIVASQFKISQRRVQQIVSLSRTTGEMPRHRQPGRRPYAVYPVDLRAVIIHAKLTLSFRLWNRQASEEKAWDWSRC